MLDMKVEFTAAMVSFKTGKSSRLVYARYQEVLWESKMIQSR